MKKLFALLLAAVLLFSVPASAAGFHLDTYFSCFFDGYRASSTYKSSVSFDALILDVYFSSKDDLAFFSQKKLVNGTWSDSGVVSAVYTDGPEMSFTLTMPDGSVFPGYFDLNGEDIWLDIGAGYFRLHRVKDMKLSDDWRK